MASEGGARQALGWTGQSTDSANLKNEMKEKEKFEEIEFEMNLISETQRALSLSYREYILLNSINLTSHTIYQGNYPIIFSSWVPHTHS